MTIQHSAIVDPDIHEPKGVAAAEAGQVYVADGSGSGVWGSVGNTQLGWYYYEDTATSATPIELTVAGTDYPLTNDTEGANTIVSFAVVGAANIWDPLTNRFDLSGLSVGDTFDIRLDIEFVSSAANDAISVDMVLGEGTASEITIPVISQKAFKAAGTHRIETLQSFFIRNSTVRDNPAKLVARSDTTGDTVVVNSWFVRVLHYV